MRLYLSSFRLGNHVDELVALVGRPNARAAVCVNALDNIEPDRRAAALGRELEDMARLGFVPEELDLRTYFSPRGLGEWPTESYGEPIEAR